LSGGFFLLQATSLWPQDKHLHSLGYISTLLYKYNRISPRLFQKPAASNQHLFFFSQLIAQDSQLKRASPATRSQRPAAFKKKALKIPLRALSSFLYRLILVITGRS
jgi:hypothetical protein